MTTATTSTLNEKARKTSSSTPTKPSARGTPAPSIMVWARSRSSTGRTWYVAEIPVRVMPSVSAMSTTWPGAGGQEEARAGQPADRTGHDRHDEQHQHPGRVGPETDPDPEPGQQPAGKPGDEHDRRHVDDDPEQSHETGEPERIRKVRGGSFPDDVVEQLADRGGQQLIPEQGQDQGIAQQTCPTPRPEPTTPG